MIGNKILSIISVLFLSTTVLAAAPALDECSSAINTVIESSNCNGSGDVVSYCISSVDKNIYPIDDTTTCKAKVGDGQHVFLKDALTSVKTLADIEDNNIGNVVLYDCDSSGCIQKFGYVHNTNGYYSLSSNAVGEKVVPPNVVGCSSINDNIGKLVTISETVKLCIADGVGAEFVTATDNENTNAKNYIMEKITQFTSDTTEGKDNIVVKTFGDTFLFNDKFTDNQYCDADNSIVKKRSDNFCSGNVLNNLYECANGLCEVMEKYLGVGTHLVNGKIYECAKPQENPKADGDNSDVTCTASTFSGAIAFKEVAATEGEHTYQTTLSDAELQNTSLDLDEVKIHVYECQKGVCTAATGYIKLGTGSTYVAHYCNGGTCSNDSYESSTCDSEGNKGTISAFNTGTGAFSICDGSDSTIAVGTGNTYAVTQVSTDYNLYIADVNVVVKSTKDGNYIDSSDAKKLHICTSGVCSEEAVKTGYYLSTSGTHPLIYCKDGTSTDCILKAFNDVKHGYYINVDKKVIACNSVGCEEIQGALPDTCDENEGKIVEISSTLKYCKTDTDDNNTDAVGFAADGETSSFRYYPFAKAIASNIDYPTILTTGSSTILLKVDQFSVTQVTTDGNGICIKSDNIKDDNCQDNSSIKYTCTTTTDPCNSGKANACNPYTSKKEGTINTNCSGYYLVKTEQLYDKVDDSIQSGVTLYYCDGEHDCKSESAVGYFKVTDTDYDDKIQFIKCTATGCQGITTPALEGCGSSIDGTIFNNGICVNKQKVAFSATSSKHFVKADSGDFVITTVHAARRRKRYDQDVTENDNNKFVLVAVSADSIKLVKEHKYNYLYGFAQVLAKKEKDVCGSGSLQEYKRDSEDIYIKTTTAF